MKELSLPTDPSATPSPEVHYNITTSQCMNGNTCNTMYSIRNSVPYILSVLLESGPQNVRTHTVCPQALKGIQVQFPM